MFGIVPRKIWGKLLPVDADNFIPMACVLYVVEANGKRYLMDTGLGDCLTDVELKIYSTDNKTNLESGLKEMDLTPDDIDVVLLTHLHTDHATGSVKRKGDSFAPRFPNAKYITQRVEFEAALNPDDRSAAAYSPERIQALYDSGQLELIEGDTKIAEGITAVVTGGHTAGHMGFEFTSGGETVVNYCDIIPTSGHIKTMYVASTDLYPLQSLEFKKKLNKRLLSENIVLAFAHDYKHTLVRITEENHKLVINDLLPVTTDK